MMASTVGLVRSHSWMTALASVLAASRAGRYLGRMSAALPSTARIFLLASVLGGCAAVRAPPGAPQLTPQSSAALREACPGIEPPDVLHHAIDLALELDPPSLSGTGELRVRARQETSVLALDAHGLRVREVAAGGEALPMVQAGGKLCALLPRSIPGGTELAVAIAWEGPTAGETPRFSADQVWAGYDAAAWMPTSMDPAQRATLTLRITAPTGIRVAASGRSGGQLPAGAGRTAHAFALERPSPPFLYAFAAGRFDEAERAVDGARLRALGPAGADLEAALAVVAPMIRFLAERTGAPLPGGEYVQAFVRGPAAQEAAGLALLSAEALDDLRADPTDDWIFSHELAHQWFGWLVPCADFADFWLNEGFATFLVGAVKEQRWGRAAYERELAIWRARSARVHAEGRDAPLSLSAPGAPPRRPPRDSELQPRGVTYFRGALVLHRLRAELGEVAFWDGVRRYVRDRAGKGARSEDLRVAMEGASGRDLVAFFARWVYATAPDAGM